MCALGLAVRKPSLKKATLTHTIASSQHNSSRGMHLLTFLSCSTGERPYLCLQCPKAFNSGSGLHHHRKKSHEPGAPRTEQQFVHSKLQCPPTGLNSSPQALVWNDSLPSPSALSRSPPEIDALMDSLVGPQPGPSANCDSTMIQAPPSGEFCRGLPSGLQS
jgi:hypothetical protein